MRFYFIIIFLFYSIQDASSQKNDFLKSIFSLQVSKDSFYNAGLFPSQISKNNCKKAVEDNNIFFTALINYTLQDIKHTLSKAEQIVVDSIYSLSEVNFSYYQNRNGDISYNFYQVNPENPFPNVKRFSKSKRALLPDDLDDTSILYLIQQTSDSLNIAVKQKMASQSLSNKKLISTYKPYRKSLAYRTWVADKMKQDLDICVMSNVLTFVIEKQLVLDSIDEQSIRLIKKMVEENVHLKNEYIASSHYQNSSIILYHIARLISKSNHPKLKSIQKKIISDIQAQLLTVDNYMEKVILLTSLYRLNQKTDFEINLSQASKDMADFYWFRANPFSGYRLWVKRIVNCSNFMQYKYKSEAYYWTLLLELKQLSNAEFKETDNLQTIMYKKQ